MDWFTASAPMPPPSAPPSEPLPKEKAPGDRSRSPSQSPPSVSGSRRGSEDRELPSSSAQPRKVDPTVRSEQAKDWAAKKREALEKAKRLREERENAAFGMQTGGGMYGDFLDRLHAAEKRDQQQRLQQEQQATGSEGAEGKPKVRRKSPIRSAGIKIKKLVTSSGSHLASPLKRPLSAAEQVSLAKATADKTVAEQKRRDAKPSAADPARELAQHGYEALGPIAAGAYSVILRARRSACPVSKDEAEARASAVASAVGSSSDVAEGSDVAVKTFDNAKCAKSKDLGEARDNELKALRILAAAARERGGARHPHIAYMLAEHEGPATTHAVLEYCPGGSLLRHMQLLQKQRAPTRGAAAHSAAGFASEGVGMPEGDVAKLTWQVASALEHMHSLDLAHRDVKPGNILFDNEGGATKPEQMCAKLCDFGFTTVCGGRMLRKLVGTPSYLAPELTGCGKEEGYRGKPVDMWALGVVLFEIIHGKPAFYGATLEQLETRIRAVSLAQFDATVSAGARALVQALLKAEPKERFTAKKVLEHSWIKQGQHPVAIERM